ncbi:uncharacterized protein LOC135155301 [Lytechinus pictus]|uniref:uncharacterized protein LOC135155301 n=1 Tax=Lytechinus pictus TaxID=7653 RepID=UPI0030BA1512
MSAPPAETDIPAERPIPTLVGSRSSFQLPDEGKTQGQPGESWPLLTPQSVDAPPSMPKFSQPGLPAMRHSISEQLGSNVPLAMQECIWKGEFVELGDLLKAGSPTCNDMTLTLDQASGGFQLRPHPRLIAIRSIEQWTSAMLIYLSIYAERQNERCRELLKYTSVVRTAAASNYNWRDYDVQFRLRHTTQPELSCVVVDTELWLLAATAQPFRAYGGGPYATQGFPSGGRQRQLSFRGKRNSSQSRGAGQSTNKHGPRLGLCFAFTASRCNRGKSCQYRHSCNHCGDHSHGEIACPSVEQLYTERQVLLSSSRAQKICAHTTWPGLLSRHLGVITVLTHCKGLILSKLRYSLHMSWHKYSANTIAAYVSGLSFYLRSNNMEDITQSFPIKRLIDGCRRRHVRKDPTTIQQ